MYFIITILISVFATQTQGESPQVCFLCNCSLVKITEENKVLIDNRYPEKISFNYKTHITEYYINGKSNNGSDRYLYMDCSADENVGQLNNLKWPDYKFLGIYGNFRRSKWRRIEIFPEKMQAQMVKLSLAENLIKDITETELKGFNQLKMLNLTQNLIPSINRTTFQGLSTLVNLDLSRNYINKIEGFSFDMLSDLKYLNLSINSISYLEKEAFHGIYNLTVLDLSYNKLGKLPVEFKNQAKSLKSLYIKNNALEWIPELPNSLKFLDLSSNDITFLNLGQTDLECLDVSYNDLSEIDKAFQFHNLKVLKASNNNITNLPHVNSKELKILDVSYNQLQSIPNVISAELLPNLEEIYLDGNPIHKIRFSEQPFPFTNLRTVGLSSLGNVEIIQQSSFAGLFYEKVLNCSEENKFPHINLSNNKIKEITENAFTGSSICSIDLRNNKLHTLSKKIFSWQYLSYIDLQQNPWVCDCKLQWVLTELVPYLYVKQPELLYELRCAAPKRFANKMFMYWFNAKDEEFCKGPSAIYIETPGGGMFEVWTVGLIVCVVLACVIIILLIALITLLCTRPRKKRQSQRGKNMRRVFKDYKEVRNTIEDKHV